MNALALTLTTAGNAALVNAAAGGTNAVVISQVGLTSTAFVPSAALAALPGEFKRIGDVAGQTASPDIIHLVVTDSSADAYQLLGFGLYLADGTLFATYGQAAELVGKASVSLLLLALDVELTPGAASSVQFGNANFLDPPATEQTVGVVRLAAAAEAAALQSLTLAVSPGRLGSILAGYQRALGFTPTRQGGGADQANNTVYLGWDGGGLKGQVDLTDLGRFVFEPELNARLGQYVQSVAGRTGVVTLGVGDVAGAAPLQSPALTGEPTAPTCGAGDNSTNVATTAFVQAVAIVLGNLLTQKAPLQSPALTGEPTAPTCGAGDASTNIATTAFVQAVVVVLENLLAQKAPLQSPELTGEPTAPTCGAGDASTNIATTAFVQAAVVVLEALLAQKAPLQSPALTGEPTAPTAGAGDNSTNIATTAFVQAAVVVLETLLAQKAPLQSPALTGDPTAPTCGRGDNSTNVATTAFVAQNAPGLAPVQSVAGRTGAVTLGVGDVAGLGDFVSGDSAGLIVKSGSLMLPASNAVTAQADVAFGAAFPNNCFHVSVTAEGQANSSAGANPSLGVRNRHAGGFTVEGDTNTGATGGNITFNQQVPVTWLAYGN